MTYTVPGGALNFTLSNPKNWKWKGMGKGSSSPVTTRSGSLVNSPVVEGAEPWPKTSFCIHLELERTHLMATNLIFFGHFCGTYI